MNTIAFLDDFALSCRTQFQRRYFSPEILRESEFFDPQYPIGYSSMHWCPEIGKYRLWYNVNHCAWDGKNREEHCMLALAESDDAIGWERKNFLSRPDGANIVFAGSEGSLHGAGVYRDARDPRHLYKCAASMDSMRRAIQVVAPGIVATSADGMNWDEHGQRFRWGRSMSDAYNCLLFNPVLNEYQLFYRATMADRRICTTHSPDLENWSRPLLALAPDAADPTCCEFYSFSAYQQDGIFYGFLWVYQTDQFDEMPFKMQGNIQAELVYSYNGIHWQRTRRPVVPLQPIGTFGATQNYLMNITPDRTGDNWLISGVFPLLEHGSELLEKRGPAIDPNRANAHYTCRIKAGRFCGLQVTGNAFLRTKGILFHGDRLTVNAACPHGKLQMQLTDIWRIPIPGFTYEDAIPFTGDETAWVPQWKSHSLKELLGKRISIEIKMFGGCLFGLTGDFYPFHGALPQGGYGQVQDVAGEIFGEKVDYDRIEPLGIKRPQPVP